MRTSTPRTPSQDQNRVGLKQLDGAVLEEGTLTVTLPPVSWSAVALG